MLAQGKDSPISRSRQSF